jgi:hypothetical protein
MAYSATFTNESNMPVNVTTWMTYIEGLSQNIEVVVLPGETKELSSVTGEWMVDNYFYTDHRHIWKQSGYSIGELCKFRSEPCIRGDYTWSYQNDFTVTYDGTFRFMKNV